MKSATTREIAKQIVAKWKRDIGQVVKYEHMEDDIETALNAERDHAFDKGYACAVANIVRLHDRPTIARDVLNQNRPRDWSVIDEADRRVLEVVRGKD